MSKELSFFSFFFSANPVELIIVNSDPDAQIRLNVVNISEFFLLSGQIKSESKSHGTEEMTANSFKLDQHFGIIEGNIIEVAKPSSTMDSYFLVWNINFMQGIYFAFVLDTSA